MLRRSKPARPGNVVAWLVLSLGVLLAVTAINLDGGRLMEERRRAVAAADAAALAAAADLYAGYWTNAGLDPAGTAKAAAVRSAQANGFAAGDVTVNVPPTAGAFAGQAGYVEVVIGTTLDATFGRAITNEPMVVGGRSVARGAPMRLGVILLRRSGADAFLNNAVAFTVLNAPLIVNSSDSFAYRQQSFGAFVASRMDIVGGYTNPGGALMIGRIRTGRRPVPDPLAFLPVPNAGALSVRGVAPTTVNSLIPTVLSPGVYRGGLRVTGASIVVMQPGVYVMEGGGFKVDGLATVTALGVMVYNTHGSGYADGPIEVTSLGKVVMTAPLSGTYQGMNFFQHRAMTNPVKLSGAGLAAITGVVYAAAARADVTGLAGVDLNVLGGAYVVDSMTVSGVGAVNVDLKLNPPRVPDVRLVE